MEVIPEDTEAAVIRMAKETQTRVTGLESNMTTVLDSIKNMQEFLQQHMTQLTVQPVNNVVQPVDDQDPEEQAWMDDATSRVTQT